MSFLGHVPFFVELAEAFMPGHGRDFLEVLGWMLGCGFLFGVLATLIVGSLFLPLPKRES